MSDINDPMEDIIRRGLKNWAAQIHPPDNGRARLLLVAASPAYQQDQSLGAEQSEKISSAASGPAILDSVFQSQSQTWFWILHMTLTPARHLP